MADVDIQNMSDDELSDHIYDCSVAASNAYREYVEGFEATELYEKYIEAEKKFQLATAEWYRRD